MQLITILVIMLFLVFKSSLCYGLSIIFDHLYSINELHYTDSMIVERCLTSTDVWDFWDQILIIN
jgi:hypothetical protein